MIQNLGALPVAPTPGHATDSLRLWLRVLKAPQVTLGFLGGTSGKESTCQCRRVWFSPSVRKTPWRRAWQPAPVLMPRKSHGQRSLVGSAHRVTKSQMRLRDCPQVSPVLWQGGAPVG